MEERGGATNKHTQLTHVKIKKERGGAHRIKKAARTVRFTLQRSRQLRQKFLPGCLKAAACYFRSVTECWCHIKKRGWRGGWSRVFCFWREPETICGHMKAAYITAVCAFRGRNMTSEREESSQAQPESTREDVVG